jgi:colicin import membrane protein
MVSFRFVLVAALAASVSASVIAQDSQGLVARQSGKDAALEKIRKAKEALLNSGDDADIRAAQRDAIAKVRADNKAKQESTQKAAEDAQKAADAAAANGGAKEKQTAAALKLKNARVKLDLENAGFKAVEDASKAAADAIKSKKTAPVAARQVADGKAAALEKIRKAKEALLNSGDDADVKAAVRDAINKIRADSDAKQKAAETAAVDAQKAADAAAANGGAKEKQAAAALKMKNAREKLDLEEAERQAVLNAEKTAGDAVKAKKLAAGTA